MSIENLRDEENLEIDLGDSEVFYVANNRYVLWYRI